MSDKKVFKFKKGERCHLDELYAVGQWQARSFEKENNDDLSNWEICIEDVKITIEYGNKK